MGGTRIQDPEPFFSGLCDLCALGGEKSGLTNERCEISAALRAGQQTLPRRRELSGARLQGRGRHAGLPGAWRRRLRLGCGRQSLRRLSRFVGAARPWTRQPRGGGGHCRSCRGRNDLRRVHRARGSSLARRSAPHFRRWRACASSRRGPRQPCLRCGWRADSPDEAS